MFKALVIVLLFSGLATLGFVAFNILRIFELIDNLVNGYFDLVSLRLFEFGSGLGLFNSCGEVLCG